MEEELFFCLFLLTKRRKVCVRWSHTEYTEYTEFLLRNSIYFFCQLIKQKFHRSPSCTANRVIRVIALIKNLIRESLRRLREIIPPRMVLCFPWILCENYSMQTLQNNVDALRNFASLRERCSV